MKALLAVMLLVSCQKPEPKEQEPKELEPVVVTTSKKNLWFRVVGSRCRNVVIDGMPCIYCESYVRGGNAPALTCDWSQKNK